MWDFIHICIFYILSLTREYLPLYEFWSSLTCSFNAYGLFPSLARHPLASLMPFMGTTCQPHMLIYGSRHVHSCLLELYASPWFSTMNNIPLCWVVLLDYLCGPFRLAMSPQGKGPWTPCHLRCTSLEL